MKMKNTAQFITALFLVLGLCCKKESQKKEDPNCQLQYSQVKWLTLKDAYIDTKVNCMVLPECSPWGIDSVFTAVVYNGRSFDTTANKYEYSIAYRRYGDPLYLRDPGYWRTVYMGTVYTYRFTELDGGHSLITCKIDQTSVIGDSILLHVLYNKKNGL